MIPTYQGRSGMGSGEKSNQGEGRRKAISARPKHFHLPLPGEQEPGGEGRVIGGSSHTCVMSFTLCLLCPQRVRTGGAGSTEKHERAGPFVLRLQFRKQVFTMLYPPVASYSLVHSLHDIFYICVPFIQLFTNLILNLLNDCAKTYPCFNGC